LGERILRGKKEYTLFQFQVTIKKKNRRNGKKKKKKKC
jgi:hypothetical protein